MDPNRWNRKKTIFNAAAELADSQRDAYVREQCQGDEELRLEIEQLLAQLSIDDRTANVLPNRDPSPSRESIKPGEVLASRFRIVRMLGRGGMGEVYEVEDLELGGRVALKTLRPEVSHDEQFLQRFKREVNLARQITHPNICRVFDVGFNGQQAFLTMELLSGQSLAERLRTSSLSSEEVRNYAGEILDALAALHARRITHRDLKPGNITITAEGSVKILDFGLAKSLAPSDMGSIDETAVMAQETRPGIVLGTVGYMSPEQALGRTVDERSDLFSFGAVLYEMATGRRPFGSGAAAEVIARLVTEQPAPAREVNPEIGDTVEFVIAKCLEKDRANRFASAKEALSALRGDSTIPIAKPPSQQQEQPVAVGRRPWLRYAAGGAVVVASAGFGLWKTLHLGSWDSLAVLPLINEGPPENEFLSDGFTESLINEVSLGDLRVIARNAVYRFARKDDPLEIARKLGVAAVLAGRLLPRGNNMVTLSLELMNVARSEHMWGKRLDTSAAALQTIQSQLAGEVLLALGVPRRAAAPPMQVRAVDPAAYELYLRGRHQWNKRTREGQEKAVEFFQQALDLVPSYAPAHAGLADAYAFQSGTQPGSIVFPKAIAAARKSLELDPNLAEAHASLAFSMLHYEWDWKGAEAECQKAISLNPSYPSGRSYYGRVLSVLKRSDEALEQYRVAQSLDPLSSAIILARVNTCYLARRHDEAAKLAQPVIAAEKKLASGYLNLAVVRNAQGRTQEALQLNTQGLALGPNDTGAIADWGMLNGLLGNRDKALEALGRLEKITAARYVLPYFFALPYIGMGDKSKALDYLEKSVEEKAWPLPYIGVEPKMDPLRPEPRFQKIAAQMRIP